MKQIFKGIKIVAILIIALAYVGCDEDDAVLPEVVSNFTFTVNADTGTVTFINISENADSFFWDFGDATETTESRTSTEINPIITYPSGTYTIVLEASNVSGASDTFEDEIVIVIPEGIELPISFDNPLVDYTTITGFDTAFSVVPNPELSGANTEVSDVGQIETNGAAFQGITIELESPADFSGTDKTIQLALFSSVATDMLVKFANGVGGARDTEVLVAHGGTGWELLDFDFNANAVRSFIDGDPENGQAFIPTGQYNDLQFFIAFNQAGVSDTFFVDNITQIESTDSNSNAFDGGLLTNGDFQTLDSDGNVTEWIQGIEDTNPAPVMTDSEGNTFYSIDITAPTPGQPFNINVSQKLDITADETYVLTFDAWSSVDRSILAGIGLSDGDFSNTTETVNITTTRDTYSVTLTTTGFGAPDARVLFDLAEEAGVVNIDNVNLVVDESGDGTDNSFDGGLLTNGDFQTLDSDGNVTEWIQGIDDTNPAPVMTDSDGNTFYSIDITAPTPGQPFNINVSQKLDITADETYVLTFDAWSSVDRSILAGIGLSDGDFSNTAETVNITTTRDTYSVTLTTTGFGAPDARVLFDLAEEAGVVNIDNVNLVVDESGGGTDNSFDGGLLTNGGFQTLDSDGNVTEWIQGVDDTNPAPVMTDSDGNTFYSIDVTAPTPGQPFNINVSQKLDITADEIYVLTFDAWSNVDRSILAGIGLSGGDFSNTAETVNITTTRDTYSVTLTTTGFGAPDARVLFDLAEEAGVVNIDNVNLVLGDSGGGGGGTTRYTVADAIDFESSGFGAAFDWSGFENGSNPALEVINNPEVSGINTSATVARVTALDVGQDFAGWQSFHPADNTPPSGESDITPFTLDASNSIIRIMVFKTVISNVGIQLVNSTNGANGAVMVANTVINQWEELTFDLSGLIGGVNVDIDRLVIFPDFAPRDQDNIILFDNITFSSN